MSDRFAGVAVIDQRSFGDGTLGEILHLVAVRENGDRGPWVTYIPVAAAGAELPPARREETVWRYQEVEPGVIEVRPSVRMMLDRRERSEDPPDWQEYFHNDGVWRIRYERLPPGSESYAAYQRVADLNRDVLMWELQGSGEGQPSAAPAPASAPEGKATGGAEPKPSAAGRHTLSRVRFSPRIGAR